MKQSALTEQFCQGFYYGFRGGLYAKTTAEREFLISKAVYKLGIPSPEPFRLVTDGERFGGEY